jgi:hypothetical protein
LSDNDKDIDLDEKNINDSYSIGDEDEYEVILDDE